MASESKTTASATHNTQPDVRTMAVHPVAEADARMGRIAGRLTTEFFLRTARMFADLSGGDLIEAMVLRAINVANTSHLDHDPRNPGRFASVGEAVPDELRRPISVLAIASSLALPYETTRRYANKLVASGECVRVKGGLIGLGARPEDARAILVNMASLRRFYSALKLAGVPLD